MKLSSFRSLIASCTLSFAVAGSAFAATPEPGYVDFGKLTPAAVGEFVEVTLDQGLLSLAAKFADVKEKEIADLLRGLKRVRVNVVSMDESNRGDTTNRVQAVRKELVAQGWQQVVTVKEQKGDDVAVFVKTKGDESIEGLVVTVMEGDRQAVFVNVVGSIRPEQIGALATKFDIDPLKNVKVASRQ